MFAHVPVEKSFLVRNVIFDAVIIVLLCDFRLVVLDGKIGLNIPVKMRLFNLYDTAKIVIENNHIPLSSF